MREPRRRGVSFGPPGPTVSVGTGQKGPSTTASRDRRNNRAASLGALGGGWSGVCASNAALLQAEQRAFGRALLRCINGVHQRPWAVRGNVPYESENCRFCAMIVVGGVRMHLPEKLFGRSWLEVRHAESGTSLVFEAMGALQSWADLSIATLDESRAGRTAWTGKSADRADLAAWANRWDGAARLRLREEYDWTYRTAYRGDVLGQRRSDDVGGAETVAYWESFRPICMCTSRRAYSPSTSSSNPSAASSRAVTEHHGGGVRWRELGEAEQLVEEAVLGAVQEESETKLYEDYLHDLGVATLSVRFRRHAHGWEARLRWWAVVNPSRTPQRGVPHARLCDTVYRCLLDGVPDGATESQCGGWQLQRSVSEKSLHFDAATDRTWAAEASLHADSMEPFLKAVQPPTPPCALRVPDATAVGPASVVAAAARAVQEPGVQTKVAEAGALLAQEAQSEEMLLVSHSASEGAQGGMLAVGWLDAGVLALFSASDGVQSWRAAAAPCLESLSFASGCNALLSSGNDGAVRVWSLTDGALLGEVTDLRGEGADMQIRNGCCVVQRVCAMPGGSGLIAAACGRSVLTLRFVMPHSGKGDEESGFDGLSVAAPRAVLPSMVVDLKSFAGSGGGCLLAATHAAGVYMWDGTALLEPSAPPSRHLSCAGSCVSLAVTTLGDCVAAACTDRTLCLWNLLPARDTTTTVAAGGGDRDRDEVAVAATEPMTFGGFSSTAIGGAAFSLSPSAAAGSGGGGAALAVAVADGSGGVVHWSLGATRDAAVPSGDEGEEAVLWPDSSLGVESTRGHRHRPGPSVGRVHAVELDLPAAADGW